MQPAVSLLFAPASSSLTARALPIRAGRRRMITSPMLEALCNRLLEKPRLYLNEMAVFLWDEFQVHVTACSISRASRLDWMVKKDKRQKAKECNPDLRDTYIHYLSDFRSYQLVYVDESGSDKRLGFRRTGWSPLGVAPVEVSRFHRDQCYQVLPAYAQDGIVLSYFPGLDWCCSFRRFYWAASRTSRKMARAKISSCDG